MKSTQDLNRVMNEYADMVRRICFVHLKNLHDTEDIFQDVYMKYLMLNSEFESCAHEKSWFIRVTINACRDHIRYFAHRRSVPLEVIAEEGAAIEDKSSELLELVLKLPEKYRNVIYLFYYEGYSAVEISRILGKNENTIYTWLSRAKAELKKELGDEWA